MHRHVAAHGHGLLPGRRRRSQQVPEGYLDSQPIYDEKHSPGELSAGAALDGFKRTFNRAVWTRNVDGKLRAGLWGNMNMKLELKYSNF